MSASKGLYSLDFKTKLLRSLLREDIPDVKHPFRDFSVLSGVVFAVRSHKLLVELAPLPNSDQKSTDSWKLAIDSWVNRLLTLASTNSPDKCWAGICLLGITCQECSPERFLTSYADWLNKLLPHAQIQAASFVKAATCASISDLFTRLSTFANAKKDATSHATRVIPVALKLLNEDSSTVVLEEAVSLICTMTSFFPLSVQRHYDNVEDAIVLKLFSGEGCSGVLQKLIYGLSLLPKARGDADSWSLLMCKILVHINNLLTNALQGLEEEAKSTETMRALLPPGKESPGQLGGSAEKMSELSTKRPERALAARISALMQCCCYMLRKPYPAMVSVPIRGIISIVERLLMIDDSLSSSSYEFMATMKHELICSEIPLLQSHALEILSAVTQGLKSQILTHAASISRLLNEYLRRCKFPDLRRKTYLIVKEILKSMGMGTAIYLSQDVVSNVFIDLDFHSGAKDGKHAGPNIKARTHKKRKHSNMEKTIQEQSANDGLEVEMPRNLTPLPLRIATLETLKALLETVGGSLKSESWRGNVDHLLINVATNAFKRAFSEEERLLVCNDPDFTWEDFQVAAFNALLASLLSPGRTRPPHLGLSLELFRRGVLDTGEKVSNCCQDALRSLEVLLHPRALPLDLHSISDEYIFQSHKSVNSQISTYPRNGPGEPESEDDDLNENWLGNDDEMEIKGTNKQQTTVAYTEKASVAAMDTFQDKQSSVKVTSVTPVPEKNGATGSASCIEGSNEFRPTPITESHVGVESVDSEPVSKIVAPVDNSPTLKNKDDLSEGINVETISSSEQQRKTVTKDDTGNEALEPISAMLARMEGSERLGLGFESDDEMLTESIPDIVDGDPDSDLDSDSY